MKPYDIEGETKFIASQYHQEKEFWLTKLSGEWVKSSFSYDFERTGKEQRKMESLPIQFPEALAAKVIKASNGSDSRLHMILTAGLIQLIDKYTGNQDIIIGIPIYQQTAAADFVNTAFALRNRLENHMSFKDLLIQVKQSIIEANEYANFPIEAIPHELGISYSENDDFPLFDIVILLENVHKRSYINHIHTNMIFSFTHTDKALQGEVEYNTCLYSKNSVDRLTRYYTSLLQTTIYNADQKIADFSILSKEEEKELLLNFNDTRAIYPEDMTIPQLFEKQVEKTPHHIAVVSDAQQVTYKQLNATTNRIAALLKEKGAKATTIVAITGKHSTWIVAGILGILKASAVYLPINARDPEDRIRFIMEDSQAGILITPEHPAAKYQSLLKIDSLKNIILIEDLGSGSDRDGGANTQLAGKPDDNMYVIYTSGTTGKPKGVVVSHRNVVNYLCWANKTYVKNQKLDFPLYTSIAFDLTVTSIFTPLITGNAIVVYEGEDNEFLVEKIVADNRVGIVKLTPSHLKLLINKEMDGKISSIKRFILGGEPLETQLAKKIYEKFNGNVEIYNEYGPTEATVGSMIYKFDPGKDHRKTVPIGIPVDNTQIYILNRNLDLLPVGAEGEIYISGDGIAKGYLYRPGLTAEKFIPNPFIPGKKMYRTGDMGKRLEEDKTTLEFKGRVDNQVKVRGFRIELGEIESRLSAHDAIKEAVVIAKEDTSRDNYLCAYFVSDKGFSIPGLREYLAEELPDYMIPAYFVPLDKIPLTQNGKVDKKALPEPSVQFENTYIAPRNEIERKLAIIWSEPDILGLRASEISIDLDFFASGGHSLKATALTNKIRKEFNIKVPLEAIFKTPTIRGLAGYLRQAATNVFVTIKPTAKKEYYPLSSAQKRIYISHQKDKQSVNYNMPTMFELRGDINKKKLEDIFIKLIKKHESLRTSFAMVGEEPTQKIHEADNVKFEIEYHDASQDKLKVEVEKSEGTGGLTPLLGNFLRPFDMSYAPLLRVGLSKLPHTPSALRGHPSQEGKEGRYFLMVDMHHIVSDGVSHTILVNEFMALYNGENLAPLRLHYKDYSQWQNTLSKGRDEEIKQQETYWLKVFEGAIPVLNLPVDYARPPVQSFEGKQVNFCISQAETGMLNRLALDQGTTLYMILLSICYILLHRLSGQEDIIIGSPTAGRNHADLQHIIGMFLNMVPLRNFPQKEKTFTGFLAEVKANVLEDFENQEYQFEDLVDKLELKRDSSRSPLFDVMFLLQNMEVTGIEIPGLKLSRLEYEDNTSKFDLSLIATEETDGTLLFNLNYNTSLFHGETVAIFIQWFKNIVSSVLQNPGQELSGIEVIPEPKRTALVEHLNRNLVEEAYPIMGSKPILQNQVKESFTRHKNRAVIEYGDKAVTYAELDTRSNTIARWIINRGIKKQTFMGILLDDRLELITILMGIIKAGCVAAPFYTAYPDKRIEAMIYTTELEYIFIDQKNFARWQGNDPLLNGERQFIFTRDIYLKGEELGPGGEPGRQFSGEDQLYIHFTSGTTGTPQAVVGKNKSLLHFINWEIKTFKITDDFHVAQFTIPGFDPFLRDVFAPLLAGGIICIPADKDIVLNSAALIQWVEKQQIAMIHCVSSLFRLLCSDSLTNDHFKALKGIMLAGERINPSDLVNWYDIFSDHIQLANCYGPTETTMSKACYLIQPADIKREKIPIGKPLEGSEIIILGGNSRICNVLERGEIHIRTPYSSCGYYNQPGLNREKFIQNPFSDQPGDILYKSGDLGRFLWDGNLDILGRVDRQVKVRGYRVELEEIEKALIKHPPVKEAVVIKKEISNNNELLCAYIVVESPQVPGQKEPGTITENLKELLAQQLPEIMVPGRITTLAQIPRKSTGKVDYDRLLEMEKTDETGYIPPRNDIEKKLLKIWSEILRTKMFGVTDSFFSMGGSSLNVMALIANIHREFDTRLTLEDIFKNITIEKQAELIGAAHTIKFLSIEPTPLKDYYVLSSAQKRLYFLQQMDKDATGYNMPELVQLEGPLDRTRLEMAFLELIHRHESLRTSFIIVNDEPAQKIHRQVEFSIPYIEADEARIREIVEDFRKPFDLGQAPLLRVGLIKLAILKYLLMIDMHHIISDGTSQSILIKEVTAFERGEKLPPLRIHYKDYAEWENRLIQSGQIEPQEKYWLKQFAGDIPGLNLKTDYQRPSEQNFEGDVLFFTLDKQLTSRLRNLIKKTDTTLYIILLAVYTILFSKYSDQEDIIVGTGIAGRRHADLTNIIGMFVNMLPIRNYPRKYQMFDDFLEQLKENVLNAFENQDYQFDQLIKKLGIKRDRHRNPLFDVVLQVNNLQTENPDHIHSQEKGNIKISHYKYDFRQIHFDLLLDAYEKKETIDILLHYSSLLFKKSTAEKIIKHFVEILEQVLQNQYIELKNITIYSNLLALKKNIFQNDQGGFGF